MKHSGRGLVWYLPVVWWLWKMIECMYKILGKEENFCWVQSPELLDSRACVELGIFIFFCLLIITKKVYTLKFDVHNMNLFLVVAHLSHKEVSSHPGYFQYLLSLLWFLAIILSEKKSQRYYVPLSCSCLNILMFRGPFSLCMEPGSLTSLIKRQATVHFLKHQSKARSIFMQLSEDWSEYPEIHRSYELWLASS